MPSYGNGFEALAYMNFFRILADLTHAFSKIILIFAIHRNRSAEGKLRMQRAFPFALNSSKDAIETELEPNRSVESSEHR